MIRVSWEWMDGSGGYEDCADEEAAFECLEQLPDEARVWIGDDMVQRGFVASDERNGNERI